MQHEAMEQTEQFHTQAMNYADQADAARRSGDATAMLHLFQKALEVERNAAEMLAEKFELEPTRSILYRSAASLALECKEFREAERLACKGLAGNPPKEIAGELRDAQQAGALSSCTPSLIGSEA